jgi:TonB family protein
MMVHLASPPPSLGVQNPRIEQTQAQAVKPKKIESPQDEARMAEVNRLKRPKRQQPKAIPLPEEPNPSKEIAESKSRGLPEGVDLGSEFGFARLDATGFDSPYYLNVLFGKIRNQWENPFEGPDTVQCTIYFVISRDGKIIDSAIEKPSGISAYDQAALRAVLSSRPPPLPGQFGSDELGIHLEFQYIPSRQ